MNGIYFLRSLLLAAIVLFITGCKLAIIVAQGGEVQSLGSGNCQPGTVCIIDITADDFSDTFTAVADPGWVFVRWNSGGDFICADSTDPSCVLSNIGFGANPLAAAIIDSEQTYYIMPVFEQQPDIVTIGDRQWYQPDLFAGLSWLAISGACPGGTCSGTLNGQDMTGWTWESVAGVNTLFNSFIGFEALDSPEFFTELNSSWAPAMLQIFRSEFTGPQAIVTGLTSNLSGVNGRLGQVFDEEPGEFDTASTALTTNWANGLATVGAWFSRPAP